MTEVSGFSWLGFENLMHGTTVWLVRHAETENPHVFNGAESDIGLSELGRLQAAAGAAWFEARKPTAVVSSVMRRPSSSTAMVRF